MDSMNNGKGVMFALDSAAEIGKAIRLKRKEKKISQQALADRMGKSMRTIQKYEAGEIDFNISTIREIADELDVAWFELLNTDKEEMQLIPVESKPSAHYRFHTLSDVISALFSLTALSDLSFDLSCVKPPKDEEWISSISVNGKGDGLYNADFCLFLENWLDMIKKLQTEKITSEQYSKWQSDMLKYYSNTYFSDTASQAIKKTKEAMHSKSAAPKKKGSKSGFYKIPEVD